MSSLYLTNMLDHWNNSSLGHNILIPSQPQALVARTYRHPTFF